MRKLVRPRALWWAAWQAVPSRAAAHSAPWVVPLHFVQPWLPWIVDVVTVLPFALIGYYPTLAYVGKLGIGGTPDFAHVLVLGLGWLVALRLTNVVVWRRASNALEVQGG